MKQTVTKNNGLSTQRWIDHCFGRNFLKLRSQPVSKAKRPATAADLESAAVLYAVLESAKLNGFDPQAWLTNVIQRMATSHPNNRLTELLPRRTIAVALAAPNPSPRRLTTCCAYQLTLTYDQPE